MQRAPIQPLMMLGRWDEAEKVVHDLQDVEPDSDMSELFQVSGQFFAMRGNAAEAERLREVSRPLVGNSTIPELALSQEWAEAMIDTVLGKLDEGYRHGEKGMGRQQHARCHLLR